MSETVTEQGEVGTPEAEHHHRIEIVVNGRPKAVESRTLSFIEVVGLAYDPVPTGPNIIFTVTYRGAAGRRHEGTLVAGESAEVKQGTVFNVSYTDKS
jgi:hypothetical protein